MIKIENVVLPNAEQWEAIIRGMRNPLNSWDKSDSRVCNSTFCEECNDDCLPHTNGFIVGENDLDLMKRLDKAGTEHRKFMRMITVYMDITAPLYWVAEHDTYKIGTVRNSCSFMHKGTSKPFEITDFSIEDKRVYEVLSPIEREKQELIYPYETNEFKIYTLDNGREYKVYKNGKVFRVEFDLIDSTGRIKHFDEKEVKPSVNNNGYYELNIGGKNGEKWLLHRLVAFCWIENDNELRTVNHIDGNKGNNSVENLEWCSLEENIKKGFEENLFENLGCLHSKYEKWKNGHTVVEPIIKRNILKDYETMTCVEIAEKYNITKRQANNICCSKQCEETDLFYLCLIYEKILNTLNVLRNEYIETKDDEIFYEIRQILPQGYNIKYTWMTNYEVLANIYRSRRNHRLPEWREFCEWIKTLPCSELITGEKDE